MSTVEVFLIVFVILVAGVRMYQKYSKNSGVKSDSGTRASSGSMFSSSSKDDDYEPYSKKE